MAINVAARGQATGPMRSTTLLTQHGGKNRRLAIDRLGAMGFAPLAAHGIEICDAQAVLEQARV